METGISFQRQCRRRFLPNAIDAIYFHRVCLNREDLRNMLSCRVGTLHLQECELLQGGTLSLPEESLVGLRSFDFELDGLTVAEWESITSLLCAVESIKFPPLGEGLAISFGILAKQDSIVYLDLTLCYALAPETYPAVPHVRSAILPGYEEDRQEAWTRVLPNAKFTFN